MYYTTSISTFNGGAVKYLRITGLIARYNAKSDSLNCAFIRGYAHCMCPLLLIDGVYPLASMYDRNYRIFYEDLARASFDIKKLCY